MHLKTILGELVGVSRGQNNVASQSGRDDLADDVLVGEANNQSVLGGVVFGLILGDQPLAGIVVGLAL